VKALLQRVSEARVTVGDELVGEIGPGLLVLLCAEEGDGREEADFLARKTANMRIFADAAGKMNRSVRDVGGSVLVVSQFTLCADTRRGNRPGFTGAAPPAEAEELCARFCAGVADQGIAVRTGRFAAQMAVQLVNDGPVTIWLDTRAAAGHGTVTGTRPAERESLVRNLVSKE
jgi:D-tyrosyl-tRNA(Tyr) deacylase